MSRRTPPSTASGTTADGRTCPPDPRGRAPTNRDVGNREGLPRTRSAWSPHATDAAWSPRAASPTATATAGEAPGEAAATGACGRRGHRAARRDGEPIDRLGERVDRGGADRDVPRHRRRGGRVG